MQIRHETPVIAASIAAETGVSPVSLHYAADWHVEKAEHCKDAVDAARHKRLAARLRAVAYRTRNLMNAA